MSVYLLDDDDPRFPPARLASPDGDGILAVGGDYSVPRLLEAYAGGIFPWSTFRGRITWHSPDPRFVLLPENFKVPRSLQRVLKKRPFEITVDRAFERVIAACAAVPRPDGGTWINDRLRAGYVELHRAGFAHSAEAWAGGELVGGLYGVSVRGVFCGESMFSLATDASKCAFATLAPLLFAAGCPMVDCQTRSAHMAHFGAAFMPRAEYLRRLDAAVRRGEETDWSSLDAPLRRSGMPC